MAEEAIDNAWKDTLPEELRGSTMVQEAKSLESIVKQATDYQRMASNSVRIPGEGAGEEDVAAFREKMTAVGMVPLDNFTEYVRPKEIGQYTITDPPSDAASIGLTQGDVDRWKDEAFEDGLSQAQFDARAQRRFAEKRDQYNINKTEFQAKEAALKDEWGEAGYEPQRQRALAAATRFGDAELIAYLQDNPDPGTLKAFAKIGKEFEESGMGDLQQPMSLPETREEASIKLAEINRNKEHPFNLGPSVVGKDAHTAASAEVMRLRRVKRGEPQTAADDMFVT